ncbi:MAG: tetratricopeptide repeat protein [Brevinema sp.]
MNNIIFKGLVKNDQAIALDAFYKGNYKQAGEIWRNIYNKNNEDTVAVKGLAFCAMMEESFREAIEYLESIKPIATKDPEIYNFIALLYLKEGKVTEATDIILNALEIIPKNLLLQKTLERIRNINNSEHAKTISIISMVQLTLPMSTRFFFQQKQILIPTIILLVILLIVGVLLPHYKSIYNTLNLLFQLEPITVTPINDIEIKDLDQIVNARENFRIVLSESIIEKKFQELKQAISKNQVNKARILASELLASNASLGVKDRVSILEAFIPEANPDQIDYVPSYAEIASAPLLYKGIIIKWNGKTTNIYKGKNLLTFDLLINVANWKKVEGIAAAEISTNTIIHHYFNNEKVDTYNNKIHYYNGEDVIITGYFEGLTSDNRVIVKTTKLEIFRKDDDPRFSPSKS